MSPQGGEGDIMLNYLAFSQLKCLQDETRGNLPDFDNIDPDTLQASMHEGQVLEKVSLFALRRMLGSSWLVACDLP